VAAGWPGWTTQRRPAPTLEQIDAHMRESIAKEPLPAAAAAAYAAVRPSVVRVVGSAPPQAGTAAPSRRTGRAPAPTPAPPHGEDGRSVGTGVVVVDNGLILTNLHVVAGAQRITVSFADGSESEADLVNLQPENDLAVLRARVVPDDLHAATLRSTADLAPGDEVIAVGFPFGIGPSASQGVVSGLKREFRSPEGERVLSNLIQFDAAANPGNSGGPLVTMDGHVVGIVTAILNPSPQRTFIGIGFAVPIESAAAAAGMPPF
jgi:S1-C subfamily serine protease